MRGSRSTIRRGSLGSGSARGGTRRARGSRSGSGTSCSGETGVNGRASSSNTVGRLGNASSIGHRLDLAERLGGLAVGMDSTTGIRIDTGEVLAFTLARLEDTINIGSRGIVLATNTIKDVLAVVGRVGTSGIAHLHTEDVAAHKAKRR